MAASYHPASVPARLLAGDEAAVADTTRWVAHVLAASAFWALRSARADLHQEAMSRVIEALRRGRFDATRDFKSYVQGVARFTAYKAIDKGVRDRADASLDDDEAHLPQQADEGEGPRRQLAIQVAREALEAASPACRTLIERYFLEQADYAEIAAEQETAVGTIKSRLFRCMRAVREKLGLSGNRPPRGRE